MSGLLAESFDRLSLATISTKYTGLVSGGAHDIGAGFARYGKGLKLASFNGNYFSFQRLLGVTRTVLYAGCAFNPRIASQKLIGGFLKDGAIRTMFGFTGGLVPMVKVSGDTTVALATEAVTLTNWAHLNVKFTFGAPGAGRVDFRINGVDAGNATGLNIGTDANTFIFGRGAGWIWGGSDGGDLWIDDVYVNDDQGAEANGWLGDRRVFSIRPSGAGSSTQMVPTGAPTNHESVDDDVQDADATYVSTANVGDSDLYTKEALADAKNISFVQLNGVFRSDDATSRTARLLLKSGAITAESADVGFTNSYINKSHILHLDPNTGAPFTVANFNAAEIGQKLTS